MKRKIDATDGTFYQYKFADGTRVRIAAGEHGVTEELNCTLKRMDNREYEKKLDAWGRKPTAIEKEHWKEIHADEPMPRVWNLSFDYMDDQGKNTAEKNLYHLSMPEESDPRTERIHELIELMPPKRKEVLSLYLEGYSQVEIAEKMELSTSTIRDHMNAAKKFLKENFFNPQF